MLDWHRYLARHRDPTSVGLLTIYHGWESGMDNSPRWDAAYAGVEVGEDLPSYRRRDTTVVTDLSQRPTQLEYDRYLWIVEELKQADYDDRRIQGSASFLTTDVFMSAVFAAANDALAELARRLGRPEADELEEYAERFRRGVVTTLDKTSGLALDTDLRSGQRLAVETLAGFAPLICGGLEAAAEEQMTRLLRSPDWTGHDKLRHPVLPTTSPTSPDFSPRAYWRGPSWPVINWFFAWALARRGATECADRLRSATLAQLSDGALAEYYEPISGEALGSLDQSWSAAAALDLLLSRGWTS